MGEVYLAMISIWIARSPLKVLPEDVASNRQRMQRFVQEAKAASALTNSNIITIHEIGTEPGATSWVRNSLMAKPGHHLRRAP